MKQEVNPQESIRTDAFNMWMSSPVPMVMVAAFVVGIICGAVSITYVLTTPTDVPLFTFQVQTGFLLWLAENSRLIAATGLSLLMMMGIISIISNIQDILHMRVSLKASA